MSHWAELDDDNVVVRILVGDNNDPNGDECYQWLIDNLGGRWIQTSYNNNFRVRYAGIGYFYDETKDAFIPPKSFESWVFDDVSCDWVAPLPRPQEGLWQWDEETVAWVEHAVSHNPDVQHEA